VAERIFDGDKYLGIIHESNGKWYVTMTNKKNLFKSTFRTCGNGIVRHPTDRANKCSEAITWESREEAVKFLMEFSK
jgi:hypothetical protein